MAYIVGLKLGGSVIYDNGFVNMYMFTTSLVLFIYSVFVQVCFSFLCVVNGGLMFSHMLAKVNNLLPGQRLKVCSWEQLPRCVDKAYNDQCTNRVKKIDCMDVNKPTFLFAFSFHKCLFLLA